MQSYTCSFPQIWYRVSCTYTLEFDEESVFSFFALHCQIDDLVKKGK